MLVRKLYFGSCVTAILILITIFCISCKKSKVYHPDMGSNPFSSDSTLGGTDDVYESAFNIKDFGAVGDDETMNTEAIQEALDSAGIEGGTVIVPEGTFLSGPLTIYGNTNFHLEKGAVLKMINDIDSYPLKDDRYENFISASHVSNVKITGKGTINGQGKVWWDAFEAGELTEHRRPQLIYMEGSSNIVISGIHTVDPPNTHYSLSQCQNVFFNNVTITAPGNSANTDGINISGQHILIENCVINTGDDNIAFNAAHAPTSTDITVKNCTFGIGHGLSIGSWTGGGLDGLVVDSCVFNGTTSGIRLKSKRKGGGLVQNLSYSNIKMTNVRWPIFISSYYPELPDNPKNDLPRPVLEMTPIWKNISLKNVNISNCPNSIIIWGLPEMHVKNVTFEDCDIEANKGARIYFADNVKFKNSTLNNEEGDKLTTYEADVSGL